MAASFVPDPEDRGSNLSPWERQRLSEIEADLDQSDPALAQRMIRYGAPPAGGSWPRRHPVMGVSLALLVLLVVAQLSGTAVAVLALLLTIALVPWLFLRLLKREP